MAERQQFAYTGPTPAAGYVGYLNIQETQDGTGVKFTVRSEGANPPSASYVIPRDEAVKLLSAALVALGGPVKHEFWSAGEADCPREIKAGNGELHTLRCKRCGQDNPRAEICLGAGG